MGKLLSMFLQRTVWRSNSGNKPAQIFHFTSVCVPSSILILKSLTWSREPFLGCFAKVLRVLCDQILHAIPVSHFLRFLFVLCSYGFCKHRPDAILCKVKDWCKRLLLISPKLKTLLRRSFVSSSFPQFSFPLTLILTDCTITERAELNFPYVKSV